MIADNSVIQGMRVAGIGAVVYECDIDCGIW
jgi:hypothetical protein